MDHHARPRPPQPPRPSAQPTASSNSCSTEDAAFYATCPTLDGDWPAHWREGLHHDFETTRLLVQPPRGIFNDVWPSWMAAWPRVVMAEGTLDMLRLAYADPTLAQRARAQPVSRCPGAQRAVCL